MRFLFAGTVFLFGCAASGQELASLHAKERVRIAMVDQSPMCEAVVDHATDSYLFLHMLSTSLECGTRGETVRVAKQQIYQLKSNRRTTGRRTAIAVLAGLGAIAGASAIATHAGSIEGAFFVIPAVPFAAVGAWAAIPQKREVVLVITCSDRFHCFSNADSNAAIQQ